MPSCGLSGRCRRRGSTVSGARRRRRRRPWSCTATARRCRCLPGVPRGRRCPPPSPWSAGARCRTPPCSVASPPSSPAPPPAASPAPRQRDAAAAPWSSAARRRRTEHRPDGVSSARADRAARTWRPSRVPVFRRHPAHALCSIYCIVPYAGRPISFQLIRCIYAFRRVA